MPRDILVFDMDGVLVDVGESYRETIRRTVAHFTGRDISFALIQDYKNAGGWNNDWALSQKIAADLGVEVGHDAVVEHFQKLFLGNGTDGLILRERWLARPGSLESLRGRFDLAVFTGRPRYEAELTLERSRGALCFAPVICAEDVVEGKPSPEGLRKIAAGAPGRALWYVGDTVDDARCARAAGVPFIGIASAGHQRRDTLVNLFSQENAAAVMEDINLLESFFANRHG